MKVGLIFLFTASIFFVSAQDNFEKEITGKFSSALFLQDDELKRWFVPEYNRYIPDSAVVNDLKSKLEGKRIVAILGTWCSDSQQIFPDLMKVLHAVNFPLADLKILGLNRDKNAPEDVVVQYKITHVPTVILLHSDGTEIGRITEVVQQSVEADLLNL